jgi:hypothetical protein
MLRSANGVIGMSEDTPTKTFTPAISLLKLRRPLYDQASQIKSTYY